MSARELKQDSRPRWQAMEPRLKEYIARKQRELAQRLEQVDRVILSEPMLLPISKFRMRWRNGGSLSRNSTTVKMLDRTRLHEKTGDLHLVQRALGHRQITTTEVHARVLDDELELAVQHV